MKTEIDRELLIRYINEQCTAEDLSRVQQFLENPEWQQELEKLLEADYSSMDYQQDDEVSLEQWNQEFRSKYFTKEPLRIWRSQWMGYAAACLLLLGIGSYFLGNRYNKTSQVVALAPVMMEKKNPRGVRSTIILPDSSVVYLGPGSSIRFPERFAAKERTLALTGEAFFEVTKNPSRPFVIHTGELQTKVLGTSFKITAFEGSLLSVEVATGKVRVSRKEKAKAVVELAVLTPGEGVSWDEHTEKSTAIQTDISAVKGWADGEIAFKKRSLAQIAAELENWYDVRISFKGSVMSSKRLSLSVDGKASLSDALDVICNTAHLKYRINGKQVTIANNN